MKWQEGTGENAGEYTAAIEGKSSTNERTFTLTAEGSNFKTQSAVKVPENVADGKEQYNGTGQSVNETEAQLNADDSYIMIIPQDFPDTGDDKLKICVEYDVVTEDPNLSDGYSLVENKITSSDFNGINFEAGKAYTFSLHLGLTSVKLEAIVDEWDLKDGKDYAVNLPLNIEDDDDDTGSDDSSN